MDWLDLREIRKLCGQSMNSGGKSGILEERSARKKSGKAAGER